MIIVKTRALSMGGLGMCRPHAPPGSFYRERTYHCGRSRSDAARRMKTWEAGTVFPEDHRRSHEAGFDIHLVKPVDAARLATVIGAVGR